VRGGELYTWEGENLAEAFRKSRAKGLFGWSEKMSSDKRRAAVRGITGGGARERSHQRTSGGRVTHVRRRVRGKGGDA